MKVPIANGHLLNLDAPTLPATEQTVKRVTRWRVWCDHCREYHLHGPGEGHREAHCPDRSSPCWSSGYNLALVKTALTLALLLATSTALAAKPKEQPAAPIKIELFDGEQPIAEHPEPDNESELPAKDRPLRVAIRSWTFAVMLALNKAPITEQIWEPSSQVEWTEDWPKDVKRGTKLIKIGCRYSQKCFGEYSHEFYLRPKSREIVAVWDRDNECWLNYAGQPMQPAKQPPGEKFFAPE